MPLLYIFCRLYDIIVSISWLYIIPLCREAEVLNFISDFNLIILVIRSGSYILRVILIRSRFTIHPTKSFSLPIDWVAYYLLISLIVFINTCLSQISRVSSMYTMKITAQRYYILYNRKISVLYLFKPAFKVIVWMYSLNRECDDCIRPQIDLIGINTYS